MPAYNGLYNGPAGQHSMVGLRAWTHWVTRSDAASLQCVNGGPEMQAAATEHGRELSEWPSGGGQLDTNAHVFPRARVIWSVYNQWTLDRLSSDGRRHRGCSYGACWAGYHCAIWRRGGRETRPPRASTGYGAIDTLQHYLLGVSRPNSDRAQMSLLSVKQFLTSKGRCTTQMTLDSFLRKQ